MEERKENGKEGHRGKSYNHHTDGEEQLHPSPHNTLVGYVAIGLPQLPVKKKQQCYRCGYIYIYNIIHLYNTPPSPVIRKYLSGPAARDFLTCRNETPVELEMHFLNEILDLFLIVTAF